MLEAALVQVPPLVVTIAHSIGCTVVAIREFQQQNQLAVAVVVVLWPEVLV
jgi:predicted alpha/beta hydrolase family esterase